MKSFYLTDAGKIREHNEDSVIVVKNKDGDYLMAVADGMGGHSAGEVASSIAISYLGKSFNEITTISQNLKNYLQQNFSSQPLTIIDTKISKDGTIKFIFKLLDNNVIESVLMKYEYGYSICVSSQVGCRMGCEFCQSTKSGLVRSLYPGEILGQILAAQKDLDIRISNIVMMGIGEPLDNFENTVKLFCPKYYTI